MEIHRLFLSCAVSVLLWCSSSDVVDCQTSSGAETFDVFVTQHPAVMTSGSDPARAQFGFSAAFHTTGSGAHSLLVGAPRDSYSNIAWRRPNVVQPGVLYRCTLEGNCQQLPVDTESNANLPDQREQKSFMRMGHSVATTGQSHPPVVCAPNFHLLWTCNQVREDVVRNGGCFGHRALNLWDPTGKCVVLPENLALTGAANNYQPCRPYQQPLSNGEVESLRRNRGTLFSLLNTSGTLPYRFNLIGFALDVMADPSNSGQTLLSAGGPGYVFNEGQLYRATLNHATRSISDSRQFGSFENHLIDHLFAYDASQGNILGDGALEIAVGMPRGQSIRDSSNPTNGDGSNRGEVRVFARSLGFVSQDQTTRASDVILRIIGGQVAEHFGHVVHAEDTNADGFKEVFVGAPMYTVPERIQNNYDHGRMAVFDLKAIDGTVFEQRIEITAAVGVFVGTSRARFGTAITSLGDLDYDGYNDIAVGAPYEEGGVVYIYMGSSAGIRQGDTPAQRVTIANAAVRGMGFSLTSRTDMDNNGFNDLGATALQSGHAVIIRSRPIINVTITIDAPQIVDHTNQTCTVGGQLRACFDFVVCAMYSLPQPTTFNATVPYTVQVTPRLSFVGTDTVTRATGVFELTDFMVQACQTHRVFVEQSLPNPCEDAFITVVEWNLVDVPSTNTLLTPILRRGPRTPVRHITQFVRRCDTCNPIIDASIQFPERAVLNALHIFDFPVEVRNTGSEFACSPTVTFDLTSSSSLLASFDSIQTNRSSRYTCSTGGSTVTRMTCTQQGGLRQQASNRFVVRVQAERFGIGYTDERTINISVLGTPANSNPTVTSNRSEESVTVHREALLQLSVVNNPQLVRVRSASSIARLPESLLDLPTLVHSFLSVINAGPGAVPPFVINASVPLTTPMGGDILYLTNVRSTVAGVICDIGSLLDPLGLANADTDRVDAANSTYPVAIAASLSPALPCSSQICSKVILCTVPLMQTGETLNITWAWRVNQDNIRRSNVTLPQAINFELELEHVQTIDGFDLTNTDGRTPSSSLVLTDGTLIDQPDEGVNIWIIIGSIVGALALFAIIVLILWKAGFFRRKRVDKAARMSQSQPPENGGNTVEAEADNEI